jgi:hypothetical protein
MIRKRFSSLPGGRENPGAAQYGAVKIWVRRLDIATLYLADVIFGFGFVFLIVTSVVCTAIVLTMDRWFGSVRW